LCRQPHPPTQHHPPPHTSFSIGWFSGEDLPSPLTPETFCLWAPDGVPSPESHETSSPCKRDADFPPRLTELSGSFAYLLAVSSLSRRYAQISRGPFWSWVGPIPPVSRGVYLLGGKLECASFPCPPAPISSSLFTPPLLGATIFFSPEILNNAVSVQSFSLHRFMRPPTT